MNHILTDAQDWDLRGVEAALRRAAQRARELGERTKTPVYVLRDGKIVNLLAENAQQEPATSEHD